MLAEVLVCRNVPIRYTYTVPEPLQGLQIGDHVEVPFGKSLAVGVIWDLIESGQAPPKNAKDIGEKLEKKPRLSQEILDFIDWLSDEYNLTPHKAYQTIIGKMNLRSCEEEKDEDLDLDPEKTPNDEQQQVIDKIMDQNDRSYLVHGVTSSGKTEIYMQIAKKVIDSGKKVIMLLPEIALTPQMRRGFKARFGNAVSVIHSSLTPKQREIEWNRIYTQSIDIIIGPRSAIFTPLENLGLIILDEEHDPSYKQENHPRYVTHTIAEYRRRYHNCRLIYGSATPGIELFYKAIHTDQVELLQLKKRATSQDLPSIQVIDMRLQRGQDDHSFLSKELLEGIETNLKNKDKTLILLNRRGYSPYIICDSCQTIHSCPECNLSYTYHKDRKFRCHRCDRGEDLTHTCRHCKKKRLNFGGLGTQKVETELLKLFPGIKICRLDRDSAKTIKALEETLDTFDKEGDILLGTQMIAKGHHFEGVTLVGVLGIDSVLNIPDFRSCERAYQLLSQVAGRAGRGQKKGHVILQTSQPDHYVIEHAITHNYEAFYNEEIDYREELRYPPFSELIHIISSGKFQNQAEEVCQTLYSFLQEKLRKEQSPSTSSDVAIPPKKFHQLIGPKPAPVEKIKDHFRYHILIKCDPETFQEIKTILKYPPKTNKYVKVIIDYHPKSLQ